MNGSKNVIIVILLVALLGVSGYLVYDKVLKDDDTNEIKNINSEDESLIASEITEKFIDLEDDFQKDYEKKYKIILNNKNYDLSIKNDYKVEETSDSGNGKFSIKLDDKTIYSKNYSCSVTECSAYYEKIAIYNSNYVVLKENEFYSNGLASKVEKYHFINENGLEKEIRSYEFSECENMDNENIDYNACNNKKYELYLDGEDIYYYANSNDEISTDFKEGCSIDVYEYKTKLTGESEQIKRIFKMELFMC